MRRSEQLSRSLAELENLRLERRPLSGVHFRLDIDRSFVGQIVEHIVGGDGRRTALLVPGLKMRLTYNTISYKQKAAELNNKLTVKLRSNGPKSNGNLNPKI